MKVMLLSPACAMNCQTLTRLEHEKWKMLSVTSEILRHEHQYSDIATFPSAWHLDFSHSWMQGSTDESLKPEVQCQILAHHLTARTLSIVHFNLWFIMLVLSPQKGKILKRDVKQSDGQCSLILLFYIWKSLLQNSSTVEGKSLGLTRSWTHDPCITI
jgi:hypothetical protein